MRKSWLGWYALATMGAIAFFPSVTLAQVIPDNTLGSESSLVNKLNELNERIDGGATRGVNLFHSFLEFNVGEGRGVYFANPAGIENILSRVTGGNASHILGRLGVLGGANLFLLNPNGILFGPNASLDIQGSFVGSTADGIKLGEDGFFSATEPHQSRLLSVNPGALFFNQAANHAGSIINQGNLAVGKDLTFSAGNLDLQGQLFAGGNLTLQGLNAVQIRDSVANPFIAAAVGDLLVQGNQTVDIFALNHPSSGLFSGGDMVLRSANTVGGDAHYWSGGSFRIEQLDGSLGNLYSPHDPVIQTLGDVSFLGYQGASLHIIAGGSVNINTVIITGTDSEGNTINPTSTPALANISLSDGTPLTIDGTQQPTLDIRAGVDSTVISGQFVTGEIFSFPKFDLSSPLNLLIEPFNFPANPSNADITIGNVFVIPPDGVVLLTNQYKPNPSLAGGEITVTETGILGNGSAVFIDARGDINLSGDINTSSNSGNGGNIRLNSLGGITLTNNLIISTTSGGGTNGKTGNVDMVAKAISLTDGAIISTTTLNEGKGGNFTLIATDSITLQGRAADGGGSFISSLSGGRGDAGNIRLETRTLSLLDGAAISTLTANEGKGGNLTLIATDSITLQGTNANGLSSFITSGSSGKGTSGDLRLETRILSLQDGAGISTLTQNEGKGGNLTLIAADSITLQGRAANGFGSSIASGSLGKGNSGDLRLETRTLSLLDGAAISTSTANEGKGGNLTLIATDSITLQGRAANGGSSLSSLSGGRGDAGDLRLETRTLSLLDGAAISTSTANAGKGGNLTLIATDSITLQGRAANGLSSFITSGSSEKGNSGDLRLETRTLSLLDGAAIFTTTFNEGKGGNLTLIATDSITLQGRAANGFGSSITSGSSGKGNSGDIRLETRILSLQDGANIFTNTFNEGKGGNLTLIATDSITLQGTGANGFGSSITSQSGGKGDAGNLTLETRTLSLQDGTVLSATTFGDGNAGNILIKDANSIVVSGGSQLRTDTFGEGNAGNVTIDAPNAEIMFDGVSIFNNELTPSGIITVVQPVEGLMSDRNGGDISITAKSLSLTNGAQLNTLTAGQGNAGNIFVTTSDSISLASSFFFSTVESTAIGQGGNININARSLSLTDGSELVTNTFGRGDAGNISVQVDDSIALANRSGILSSVGSGGIGKGGNIDLQARSLSLTDGSQVQTNLFRAENGLSGGQGQAGSIEIVVSDFINLAGVSPDGFSSGLFASTEKGASGPAGSITVATNTFRIADGAVVNTLTANSGNAGDITINANTFEATGGGQVITTTRSNGRAGNITLNITDSTAFSGSDPNFANRLAQFGEDIVNNQGAESGLFANTTESSTGQGGTIDLQTRSLTLNDRAQISSSTAGAGNTGEISIQATNSISLAQKSQIISEVASTATGNAQQITLNTPKLTLTDNAQISAATAGQGNAGSILVSNADTVTLDNSIISTAIAPTGKATQPSNIELNTRQLTLNNNSQITASTQGKGDAGSITVPNAQTVSLDNNSQISASTSGVGDAGDIFVQAATVTLDNNSAITTTVNPGAIGQGGNITIQTGDNSLTLNNQSQISSRSQGQGNAGNITITSLGRVNATNSDITTSAEQASGGAIEITAQDIRLNGDSDIRTNVNSGVGGGGNITLTADSILAFDDSDILAFARDGQGGNITLNTPVFFGEGFQSIPEGTNPDILDGNDRVDINASGAVSGAITLPDLTFIQNSLTELPGNIINTESLIANSCVVPNRKQAGTFIITGSGGLPARPGDAAVSPYPTGTVRTIHNGDEPSSRQWQPGNPIVEPQGVYRLSNGQLVMSRECPR